MIQTWPSLYQILQKKKGEPKLPRTHDRLALAGAGRLARSRSGLAATDAAVLAADLDQHRSAARDRAAALVPGGVAALASGPASTLAVTIPAAADGTRTQHARLRHLSPPIKKHCSTPL